MSHDPLRAQAELRAWLAAPSAKYLIAHITEERDDAAAATLNINPLKDPTGLIGAQERYRLLNDLLRDENLYDALCRQAVPKEETEDAP